MSKWALFAWISLGYACAAIFGSDAASLAAAPNREPLGKSGQEELPAIELTHLEKEGGAVFGDWLLWNHDQGGHSIFLINQKTRLAIYLPWVSNGWINYRTNDGTWYVLFPTGAPSLQNRSDLNIEKFLGKKAPAVRLANGKYVIKGWTVAITNDGIDFHTPNVASRINIRAASPEFTHNARTIGGK
jgi:hypothetical protein